MGNFYQLISNIERRPSMYLGQPSISNLQAFLSGYIFARREQGIASTLEEEQFSEFQDWVKAKYKDTLDQSWDKIILFHCEDEKHALHEFFELFHEFSSAGTSSNKPRSTFPNPLDSPHSSSSVDTRF